LELRGGNDPVLGYMQREKRTKLPRTVRLAARGRKKCVFGGEKQGTTGQENHHILPYLRTSALSQDEETNGDKRK